METSKLRLQKINFRLELKTLITMRNNVLFVHFLGWYQDYNFIYLAMEYIEHGDLDQYLKNFGTKAKEDAREITKQVLEALVELHSRKICHRDLKPQNILVASLSPIRIKIADFGTSKCVDGTGTILKTQLGTIGYQAPEVLGLLPREIHQGTSYANSVDIWALGCLVFKILTLETPFMEIISDSEASGTSTGIDPSTHAPQTDMRLFHAYCSSTAGFPTESLSLHVNELGVDFIKKCLVPNPRGRILPGDALGHEWIVDDPEDLRNQFLSLGISLSLGKITELILKRKSTLDADIRDFFPPQAISDIAGLAVAAASKGYLLGTKILFEILNVRAKTDPTVQKMLQSAAGGGHLEVVRFLLDKGAGINSQSRDGVSSINAAAGGGHLEVVKFLLEKRSPLEKGANIDSIQSWDDPTGLQAAAGSGHLEVVRLLLENGANTNSSQVWSGLTALHVAARSGHLQVVRFLLEKGADINSQSRDGVTPINAAVGGGHVEVVRFLLEKGADINRSQSLDGLTALHIAAKSGCLEVVRLLLENDVDINDSQSRSGLTALHVAAKSGRLEVVRHLLGKGADISSRSRDGVTPINAAAGGGHLEVVKFLLEKGANINRSQPCSDPTPLQAAAEGGHLEVVRFLLEKGFDSNNSQPWNGLVALQAAAGGGHLKVVRFLLEKGFDSNNSQPWNGLVALQAAARAGHLEAVRFLLEMGADINSIQSRNGLVALQAAVKGGHHEIVKFLLEKGTNINIRQSRNGLAALQAAAGSGQLEVVRLLLEMGVDINCSQFWNGLTALQVAAGGGNLDVMRFLLEKGANINDIKNDFGDRPKIARFLKEYQYSSYTTA